MSATITFEDFSKIDLRIGTIIEVKDFPEARNPAYQLSIVFKSLTYYRSLFKRGFIGQANCSECQF